MEVKIKNGQKIILKDLSIDDRDILLDSLIYENEYDRYGKPILDENGNAQLKMVCMHATMTKFLRTCVKDCTDEFLESLNFEDKTEIFTLIQGRAFNLGKKSASK